MSRLSDAEIADLAADFEAGWSEDRLDRASQTWGPSLSEILPASLAARLHERARAEGVSDIQIVSDALRAYLGSAA